MAEDVERVVVKRTEGSPDRSGPFTIIGIILGVLIVAAVALAIIGVPELKSWWGDSGSNSGSSTTVITTPAPESAPAQ